MIVILKDALDEAEDTTATLSKLKATPPIFLSPFESFSEVTNINLFVNELNGSSSCNWAQSSTNFPSLYLYTVLSFVETDATFVDLIFPNSSMTLATNSNSCWL